MPTNYSMRGVHKDRHMYKTRHESAVVLWGLVEWWRREGLVEGLENVWKMSGGGEKGLGSGRAHLSEYPQLRKWLDRSRVRSSIHFSLDRV